MDIHFPDLAFVRYADDIIIHCRTERQALYVLDKVKQRLHSCDLTAHPEKTKIVHCKDYRRMETKGKPVKFDFLGFSFKPMSKQSNKGGMFLGYDCELSKKSRTRITAELRQLKFDRRAKSFQDIANLLNDKIRGWAHYYDKFRSSALKEVFYHLHYRLAKWIIHRYKRFKRSWRRAYDYLKYVRERFPNTFYHWTLGYSIA